MGLKAPSPLLLYAPTFTSNGEKGGIVSLRKTYRASPGVEMTARVQVAVPAGRKAMMYPKPSPFCSSSGTGWEQNTKL